MVLEDQMSLVMFPGDLIVDFLGTLMKPSSPTTSYCSIICCWSSFAFQTNLYSCLTLFFYLYSTRKWRSMP